MEDSSIAVESPPSETQPAAGGHDSFNFSDPGHSIREGIRRLESAHEAFAMSLERTLGDSFGIPVRLSLLGITQSSLDRYLAELPPQGLLAALSLEPFSGSAMFELSASVGLPLIDIMLGGSADGVFERKPTAIERQLLQRVGQDAINALAEALKPFGISAGVETWEADPQFMQGAGELVILISYGLSFGEAEEVFDRLVVSYPLPVIQAIAGGRRDVDDGDGQPDGVPAEVSDHLPEVPIPFAARLQTSFVSFVDLAALEPGDVLRLDHAIDDPIVGIVGSLPLVLGKLGVSKNKLALEISGWIEHD